MATSQMCPKCGSVNIKVTCMHDNNRCSCIECGHRWHDQDLHADDWTTDIEGLLEKRIKDMHDGHHKACKELEHKVMVLSRNNLDLMGKNKELECELEVMKIAAEEIDDRGD